MHTRDEVKTGAVVAAAAALCCVSLVGAGHLGSLFAKKQTLRAVFTDIQGLKVDAPVEVMGLECGKVRAIAVAELDGGPALEVTARIAYPKALSRDTKALVSQSITGSTILKVEPGRDPAPLGSERLVGAAPMSMTDLSNKAGIIAQRLDDFVSQVTDRKLTGAAREAVANIKNASQEAKTLMASLSQSLPGTQKSLAASARNIEQLSASLNQALSGRQAHISETVVNMHAASQSMARAGDNVDKLIAKDRDSIHTAIADAAKTTANMKALSREVRWKPWVLLHKPTAAELRERGIYNTALEFSEGAEALSAAVKELAAYASEAKGDSERFKALALQVHEDLEKSAALERRLWKDLTEKEQAR